MSKPGQVGTPPGSAGMNRPVESEPAAANTPEEKGLESQPTFAGGAGVSVLGDTMAPVSARLSPSRLTTSKFPVVHWERYEFLQLLGKGGMGAVYKARDPRLDRLIALKFIHSSDDQMILRFMQEARTQARIDHPGICKISARGRTTEELAESQKGNDPVFDPAPSHAAPEGP